MRSFPHPWFPCKLMVETTDNLQPKRFPVSNDCYLLLLGGGILTHHILSSLIPFYTHYKKSLKQTFIFRVLLWFPTIQ